MRIIDWSSDVCSSDLYILLIRWCFLRNDAKFISPLQAFSLAHNRPCLIGCVHGATLFMFSFPPLKKITENHNDRLPHLPHIDELEELGQRERERHGRRRGGEMARRRSS